jgi:hypothetical protein
MLEKAFFFSCWLVLATALAWALPLQGDAFKLPAGLNDQESRAILKEQGAKSHVGAAIKVAEQRLVTALKAVEAGQFEEALQSVIVYEALYAYADAYTRRLPASAQKDRNKCLKDLEQAIFKQRRPLEAVRRELPFQYREQTDPLVESLKRLRLRALNDVIGGGTIIKESSQ